jgi:phosphatidylserine/phosphatidylglycerophosphate/cardiolipin synthase-like enzyme
MTAAPRRASARQIFALMGSALLVAACRRVLAIKQLPSWPPPDDAVTSEGAEAATQALAEGGGARPHHAVLDFAWSTAATIEPWVEGAKFFPRIFADIEAARSSVHILMFGWREGEVGIRMAALLEQKLAEGVEVGDRRRNRVQALPGRTSDVHATFQGGGADRHQRHAPARP